MKSKSFSTRLSLNVLLIVSILFVVALSVVAIFSHILISKEAQKSSTNMLNASISDIEQTLLQVESTIQNASWLVKENEQDEEYLYHITQKVVDENPFIVGSTIAFDSNYVNGRFHFAPYSCKDEKTGAIKSLQLGEHYDYFASEWYRKAADSGKPCWSEPYFDKGGGELMMSTFSYPILDNNNQLIAIITADISLKWLTEKVAAIRPYEHSYASLTSQEGHYLSRGENYDLVNETLLTTAQKAKDTRVMELSQKIINGESGMMRYEHHGKSGFAVFGPLHNGWALAITCLYRDVLEQALKMDIILAIICIIGILIMLLVCHRTIRHMTQPLTEFSTAAHAMAKGNFQAQLPVIKTKDEIMQLHDSFEYLQQSLTTYISELKITTKANERMESELNIARSIQFGMLPKILPKNKNCSVHALLTPAKEVGGDLYDYQLKDNMLYFAIGDVSGKGVPASLVMAITLAACRFFNSMELPMKKLVGHLNNNVSENNEANMFVTMFAGRIDLEKHEMVFCNAGHNPIIVIPPDEKPYFLKAHTNLAVGIFPDFQYQDETLFTPTGTRLILFTDGVTEAENHNQELYGNQRLLTLVSAPEFKQFNAQEMTDAIYASVKNFTEGNEQNDDITILSIIV
ncbi:MAG: SpoIIE family protein phosphatase [Bacteroidales bacterium]|nr:SpoIIE family protein phosphatase [Bacteroidales bacterium]